MKTMQLISIEVVLDSPQVDDLGEFDYGVPYPDTSRWINRPGNRARLEAYLRVLADKVRDCEPPFRAPEPAAHSPAPVEADNEY